MSTSSSYADAWERYRAARAAVVGAPTSRPVAADADQTEAAAETFVAESEQLREQLTRQLDSSSVDERQLAQLQLQAAAALDVDTANALVAAGGGEGSEGAAPRRSFASARLTQQDVDELEAVLSVSPDDGIRAVRGLGTHDISEAASPDLTEAVRRALDGILTDTSATVAGLVSGITRVPGDAALGVAGAVGKGLGTFAEMVGADVGWLLRKAVKIVGEGVKKVLAAFGTDGDKVLRAVGGWVDGLTPEKVREILAARYGVEQIEQELTTRIDGVGDSVPADRLAEGVADLDDLAARLHKQNRIIDKLVSLLGFAQKWLVGISPPLGAFGVIVAYVAGTAFVLYSGGDYLDWREDGIFDTVAGVRHIVGDVIEMTV